jgi:hypothetical protein
VNAATDSADAEHRMAISDLLAGLAYKFDGNSFPMLWRN